MNPAKRWIKSGDSIVGSTLGCGPNDPGSIPGRRNFFFPLALDRISTVHYLRVWISHRFSLEARMYLFHMGYVKGEDIVGLGKPEKEI